MNRIQTSILVVILLGFIMALVFFPTMPQMMASHWDIYDQPNKFLPKEWALFAIPALSLFFYLLFTGISKLDPYRDSIEEFKIYYYEFLLVLVLFLFYLHFVMIIWNSGIRFQIGQLLAPAFGGLIYYLGAMLSKTKRNYVLGVRTPWTVRSDVVWDNTHLFAGTLFKIAGIVACIGFFIPEFSLYFIAAPLALAIFYTVFYSYIEYKLLPKKKRKS